MRRCPYCGRRHHDEVISRVLQAAAWLLASLAVVFVIIPLFTN